MLKIVDHLSTMPIGRPRVYDIVVVNTNFSVRRTVWASIPIVSVHIIQLVMAEVRQYAKEANMPTH